METEGEEKASEARNAPHRLRDWQGIISGEGWKSRKGTRNERGQDPWPRPKGSLLKGGKAKCSIVNSSFNQRESREYKEPSRNIPEYFIKGGISSRSERSKR